MIPEYDLIRIYFLRGAFSADRPYRRYPILLFILWGVFIHSDEAPADLFHDGNHSATGALNLGKPVRHPISV
jgi:hypothetical protein